LLNGFARRRILESARCRQQQRKLIDVSEPQRTPVESGLTGGNGLSLRNRFLIVFLLIFLGGATAGYWVISWFSQDVVRTLSGWFAEKNVLYEKSKVLQLMLREVVLAQKMASSPVLKAWVRNEADPQARARAVAELEDYRVFFRSRSYFFAIAGSGNYYFNDDAGGHDLQKPRYTLEPSIAKDGWFYETLRHVGDYQLNVDTDRHLQVTRVWINTVLRVDGQPAAVIGTGVDLTDFITSVVGNTQPGVTNLLLDRNGAIQAHQDVSKIDFASIAKESRNEQQNTVFDMLGDARERDVLSAAFEKLSAGTGDTHTLDLTLQGQRHVAGVTYLPEIKWFLVTLTHPEAAESRHYVTAAAAVMTGALALTLLFAGLAFNRMVLRRLAAFDGAARRIASGDYAVSVDAGGHDELGRLARTFQTMADRIAAHTTELESQVAQRTQVLERLAYADFLTGLLNRRGIIDRLEMERNRLARQHARLGIVLLDLDHFKRINDNHGHDAGDRALVHVANTIRGVMRSYDVCARWGGEEFLVIVPGIADREMLLTTAEKLRAEIKTRPFVLGTERIVLTASVGCYLAQPAETIDAMLKAADDALYSAKSEGRDRIVVAAPASGSGH
jgi:diguanylate cyclase (GGDEF)-like protein